MKNRACPIELMAPRKAPPAKAKAKPQATKKPLKTVIKQNQMRTEYKDRISLTYQQNLGNSFKGSATAGPSNSSVFLPDAMVEKWQQGTSNGNIDGNQINPRFLNMKMELDFSQLPTYVISNGVNNVPCHYYIRIRQCLVMEDISESFTLKYTNPTSGRQQRALQDDTSKIGTPRWLELARLKLFNNGLDADFLSYEKRQDSKVRILKTHTIKYDLNDRLNTGGVESITPSSRKQRFSFDWKMPKEKQILYPLVDTTDPQAYVVTGHSLGKMWIPCVLVTMERSVTDDDQSGDHRLEVSYISHFTYTDN